MLSKIFECYVLIVSGRDQDKCPPRSFYNKHARFKSYAVMAEIDSSFLNTNGSQIHYCAFQTFNTFKLKSLENTMIILDTLFLFIQEI